MVLEGNFIQLAGGHKVILDPEDIDRVSITSWHYHLGYARGTIGKKKVYMHRFILDAAPGDICDHLNGNKLDNRKSNLRITDKYGNSRNRVGQGYLGVYACEGKWDAKLIRGKKTFYFGRYDDERVAAYAVDCARVMRGEILPRPNVPGYEPRDEIRIKVVSYIEKALFCYKFTKRRGIKPFLSKKAIEKIRNSKLSNKYWATYFNVPQYVIKEVRK